MEGLTMGTPSRLDLILGRSAFSVDEITKEEWIEILTNVLKTTKPWLKYISGYDEAREILNDTLSDGYKSVSYKAPAGEINPVELCLSLAEFTSSGSNIDYSILLKRRGAELVVLSRHWIYGPDTVSKMYEVAEFSVFDIKELMDFLIPGHPRTARQILKKLWKVLEIEGDERIERGKRMKTASNNILQIFSRI